MLLLHSNLKFDLFLYIEVSLPVTQTSVRVLILCVSLSNNKIAAWYIIMPRDSSFFTNMQF